MIFFQSCFYIVIGIELFFWLRIVLDKEGSNRWILQRSQLLGRRGGGNMENFGSNNLSLIAHDQSLPCLILHYCEESAVCALASLINLLKLVNQYNRRLMWHSKEATHKSKNLAYLTTYTTLPSVGTILPFTKFLQTWSMFGHDLSRVNINIG